ncbi:MAG: uracil-DNA glycosylase family protein [Janthinobacterium lividum]
MSDITADTAEQHVGAEAGLKLDARQRAMLEEMGVKVWWPAAVPPPPSPSISAAPVPSISTPSTRASGVSPAAPVTASPETAFAPRVTASGIHVVLVDAPRRLYGSPEGHSSDTRGGWLVVADMPPDADGRHGDPLSGDAGRLLDNMLRALQLHGGALPVHLMRTHRGGVSGREGHPQPFGESFQAHAEALAPRVILAMGPLAAQSLLQSTDPLGRLRGRAVPLAASGTLGGVPVVATYHPAYLLRNMADKARAWTDLCLAAGQVPQR